MDRFTTEMAPTCWVLTDGSVGMENQGLAVAEAVGLPVTLKRVHRTGLGRLLPTSWQLLLPAAYRLGHITAESDMLTPPWPRLVISIGRHSVPLALAIRRVAQGATFTLHIQNPKVPLRYFDLVTAPAHDGMDPAQTVITLGAPHRVTADRLAEEAPLYAAAIAPLPHPRIAVLLGGNSKGFHFDSETGRRMGKDLAKLATDARASLLVTPSRRTPPAALAALKTALGVTPAHIWNGRGPNPYFAFLALCDAVVVTSDSVNMVTEAAGTGKPVYVYPLPGRSKRIAAFHAAMARHGATRQFDGHLDFWSYAPVNDTERIAAAVRKALGLRGRGQRLSEGQA